MQVELMKKEGTYVDKQTQKEKTYVNFYLQCGDTLIPVEPVYYSRKDAKTGEDLKDLGFVGRKEVLKAFASILPDKEAVS